MKKLRIVIVETSIEKVPKELHKHPSIINDAKRRRRRPDKILLYIPIHYGAMHAKGIKMEKRGRPDILHRLLIIIQDHPLNKSGYIELYFHTIHDEIYWVNPATRPPLHYYGFEGLMIQLLEKGRIPPEEGDPLIKKINKEIVEVLTEDDRKVYALDREGIEISSIPKEEIFGNTLIIGGFQKGSYRKDIEKLVETKISLAKETLKASTAACMALTTLYQHLNI